MEVIIIMPKCSAIRKWQKKRLWDQTLSSIIFKWFSSNTVLKIVALFFFLNPEFIVNYVSCKSMKAIKYFKL